MHECENYFEEEDMCGCGCNDHFEEHHEEHHLHLPHERLPHPHKRGILPPFFISAAILKIISKNPMHGYQIAEEISKMLGKEIPKPIVYITLKKLESFGFVVSKWEMREKGPARKVYYITEEGLMILKNYLNLLKKVKAFIDKLLKEE